MQFIHYVMHKLNVGDLLLAQHWAIVNVMNNNFQQKRMRKGTTK